MSNLNSNDSQVNISQKQRRNKESKRKKKNQRQDSNLFVKKKAEKTDEIRILCRFCELKNTCNRRQRKQKYEDAGFVTYCTTAKPIIRSREEIERAKKFKEEGRKNSRRHKSIGGNYN